MIAALIVQAGWDYEGSSVLGVFNPTDELGAFELVLETMTQKHILYDYITVTHHASDDTRRCTQNWKRQAGSLMWEKKW